MLENRGYSVQHVTNVMSVDLDKAVLDTPVTDVLFTDEIPDFWIRSLFDLKGTTNPIHRTVVPSMYRAILKETVCASITKNGQIIATGLGILDRDYIGIYAIHVREDYRRRGYARQIVSGLLKEGKKRGASHAYLQVVKNNDSAEKLYSSLGFRYFYTYWFRVQPVGTRFSKSGIVGIFLQLPVEIQISFCYNTCILHNILPVFIHYFLLNARRVII